MTIDWSRKREAADIAAETETETEAARLTARQDEARARLADTDWYVTRMAETGVPVPCRIAAERAAARTLLSE